MVNLKNKMNLKLNNIMKGDSMKRLKRIYHYFTAMAYVRLHHLLTHISEKCYEKFNVHTKMYRDNIPSELQYLWRETSK